MELYENIVEPILDRLDSEKTQYAAKEIIHTLEAFPFTLKILERIANRGPRFEDKRLNVSVGGLSFENPLFVGAGWDKSGRAVRGLHAMGFAGVEVGSVLHDAQPGNPKPRQWYRSREGVALNRLGFNSPGMHQVAENLQKYLYDGIPMGISIGVNKADIGNPCVPEKQAAVAKTMLPFASYFALNVSSPNTPGLRALQGKDLLKDSVQAVTAVAGGTPIFIKIAPDLELLAIDDVIEVAEDYGVAGIIAANTTVNPNIKAQYGWTGDQWMGGLSGNDDSYRDMINKRVSHIYRQTKGSMGIIGVGGIHDVYTALERIENGASVLQIVTGIPYEGPTVASDINRDLVEFMATEGIGSIQDLIGNAHANLVEA